MTTAFRGIATASTPSGTSLSIPLDAATQPGDGLLLGVQFTTGPALTVPAGWVAAGSSPVVGGSLTAHLFKKVATSGDVAAGAVAISVTGVAIRINGFVLSASGTDGNNPVHAIAAIAETATTSTHTMPSVATTKTALIVYVLQAKDSSTAATTTLTQPASATLRATKLGAGGSSQQVTGVADSGTAQAAGTHGGGTFASNVGTGQGNAVMWTIALNPAPDATQTLRPTADVTVAGAVAVPALAAGETFASRVGETVRDDTTYVESPPNPSAWAAEFDLGMMVDPGAGRRTGYIVSFVLSSGGGSTTSTFFVEVRQPGVTAAVASWTKTDVLAPTLYQRTLTDVQVATIDYTKSLRLQVTETAA